VEGNWTLYACQSPSGLFGDGKGPPPLLPNGQAEIPVPLGQVDHKGLVRQGRRGQGDQYSELSSATGDHDHKEWKNEQLNVDLLCQNELRVQRQMVVRRLYRLAPVILLGTLNMFEKCVGPRRQIQLVSEMGG
jgi:hypothetical protein